jgi:entericidin B
MPLWGHLPLTTHRRNQMKKVMMALIAAVALPTLAACNTIEGVGKDVKAGGQAVEETAKEVKEEITK